MKPLSGANSGKNSIWKKGFIFQNMNQTATKVLVANVFPDAHVSAIFALFAIMEKLLLVMEIVFNFLVKNADMKFVLYLGLNFKIDNYIIGSYTIPKMLLSQSLKKGLWQNLLKQDKEHYMYARTGIAGGIYAAGDI